MTGEKLNLGIALVMRSERGQFSPDWGVTFALRNQGVCLNWLYTGQGQMTRPHGSPHSAGLFPLYRCSNTPRQLQCVREQLRLTASAAGKAFRIAAVDWRSCEQGRLEPSGVLLEALAARGVSINAIVMGEGRLLAV